MVDAHDLMRGFPPPPEARVTLANWRQAPFNRWALRNVRRIVPTARVRRGPLAWPLERAIQPVERIPVPGPGGKPEPFGRMVQATYGDGCVVLHRGRVVFERYDDGMAADDTHILFSVTKSVSATLAGVLVDRGQLDPDAPVTRYVPEAKGSAYGTAKVRHVLDMTVGIAFVEDYLDTKGDFQRYREATGWTPTAKGEHADLRSFLVTLKPAGRHGERFHYVSPNSDLLGWIMERASGVGFAELLARELWILMGAEEDADLSIDRLGAARAAGGLCATTRDLARFGQMVLERGVANGRQVIPGGWIDDIRANGDARAWAKGSKWLPGGRYRSKWYVAPGGPSGGRGVHFGLGIHGQWLYIDPAAAVVIAKFSSDPNPSDDALDDRHMAAFDAVARAFA
ncbi:MAG: serine hydrolase domain-containing protein [Alphaproteobacteria bacterium]